MARTGRPATKITLSADEREVLERYTRRGKTEARLSQRARIVLLAADGKPTQDIASTVGVTAGTVSKWRKRFAEKRLDGLLDEPRPGTPRTVSDDKVEEIVVRTLEEKPADATHWSTRDMAKKAGVSHSTVNRIWRAFGLQPHVEDTFVLSTDPQLIEKVRDIVGLYLNPPENAVVMCIDEKSQIQALNRTQPLLPMRPGQAERRTHDYERHGTTTLFAALEVATGKVIGKCTARHRAKEFIGFLRDVEKQSPEGFDVHVVVDNASSHKTEAVKRWFARRPHWHIHFTATKASWLNLVERWFGLLTQKKIKRGSHRSVKKLKADIQSFIEGTNADPKPFKWVKTADEILASIARFCERTTDIHID
jgi:transposase